MQVVILSYKRPNLRTHTTYTALKSAGVPVLIAVRPEEYDAYAWAGADRWMLPKTAVNVQTTRDSILYDMNRDEDVCMMDDDLDFAVRRDDDRTKFRPAQPQDISNMVQAIADGLIRGSPHVSIAPREGGNRRTEEFIYDTRVMRVLAYNRQFMRKNTITFAPAEFMGDFHVALQILRSGRSYLVLNNWVSNQHGGSGAPGGCSVTRTPALQTAEAHRLAALHPGFVKAVEKPSDWPVKGGTRTDVIVSWKKARAAGESLK